MLCLIFSIEMKSDMLCTIIKSLFYKTNTMSNNFVLLSKKLYPKSI